MTWDEIMQEVETIESLLLYVVHIHSNGCTIQHKNFNPAKHGQSYYFDEVYADTKKEAVILAIEKFKKHFNL